MRLNEINKVFWAAIGFECMALLFVLGAVVATVYLLRFFKHEAVSVNGKRPGYTGAKMILWSVIIGVASKSIATYYYPEFFSGLFIISQMVKSLGLSYISLHLFLLAYNQNKVGYNV